MDEDETPDSEKQFQEQAEVIKKQAAENKRDEEARIAKITAQEAQNKPLNAIVYLKNGSSYQAEIWETVGVSVRKPNIMSYSYWIWITDQNFVGHKILDSMGNENNTIDIIFENKMMRDLKGFKFRHFAGNAFRVKFLYDLKNHKVIHQTILIG